jgi:hypothetical protein
LACPAITSWQKQAAQWKRLFSRNSVCHVFGGWLLCDNAIILSGKLAVLNVSCDKRSRAGRYGLCGLIDRGQCPQLPKVLKVH